jgi:FAD/FMN-containing dehydrogenase
VRIPIRQLHSRRSEPKLCQDAMQSFLTDAVYVNYLGEEGEERVRSAYSPATYARLSALKRKYDPANLFRLNQNIKPAP